MRRRGLRPVLSCLVTGTLVCGLFSGCSNNTATDTTTAAETQSAVETQTETETETVPEETTTEYETEADVALNVTPVSVVYEAEAATGPELADIYVEPIEDISDDFMYGVDISTILTQEEAGVKYYDLDGNEQDIFKILADGGVNYIRVRIWNDPYDSEGHGYGGGNCDVQTACEIGKRAAEYGMKLFVDFHYSDFWADPNKQMVPKAWEGLDIENLQKAIYQYTRNSLVEILNAGADVGMVQIGNEINYGLAGTTTDWSEKCALLSSASSAVREVSKLADKDILVACHFTDVSNAQGIIEIAGLLDEYDVDYDVFALSYYMYWHGSLDNLNNVMQTVSETYGKKIVIAETAYSYTNDDGDGTGNSVDSGVLADGYAATVQSQACAVRDVCAAVSALGDAGLGVFYWEPAWTPVNHYDWEAEDAADVLAANEEAWEAGAGWATSYSAEYDPDDAGKYYGGSAWDNQAWFDFDGYALPTVNIYRYLKYGTECELSVDFVNDIEMQSNVGDELKLPETVYVYYNDRSEDKEIPVTWDAEQVAEIDTSVDGDYEITGTLEDGTILTLYLSILYINYVENPSFEDEDTTMWTILYDGDTCPADFQNKSADAKTGDIALHFWDDEDFYFSCEQTIEGLDNGTYYLSAYAQGGDTDSTSDMYIFATAGDAFYTQSFTVDGWVNWQLAEIPTIEVTDGTITIGVSVSSNSGSWGTIDDFYLCKVPDNN